MLPRARLGNNARLAKPLGQHGLPQRIVNLVGARVGQVLALETNLRALRMLREPTSVVQRRRKANIVPTQLLELLPKARVLRRLHVRVNEVMMRLNERLGDKTATELLKSQGKPYHRLQLPAKLQQIQLLFELDVPDVENCIHIEYLDSAVDFEQSAVNAGDLNKTRKVKREKSGSVQEATSVDESLANNSPSWMWQRADGY
ncbi:hypothetical protein PsorP6_004508 [Peronosclerospora sorghi]|uniref:Uncharacterized protein n=1 Tax=Peronosclerospora sorghi TaxID=230839 RepID=A0ACC0VQ74_9STRA|nr:hypothetical protein PsorP6_004508 [Peronosclerospora sorghi]